MNKKWEKNIIIIILKRKFKIGYIVGISYKNGNMTDSSSFCMMTK